MGNAAQPEMAYQWGHGSHWYMLIWSLDKIPFAQIGSQFADLDKIPYSKSEKNAKGILSGFAKRERDFLKDILIMLITDRLLLIMMLS